MRPPFYPYLALASHFTSAVLSFCICKGRKGLCTIPSSSEVISVHTHTCTSHWRCDTRLWLTWHRGTWLELFRHTSCCGLCQSLSWLHTARCVGAIRIHRARVPPAILLCFSHSRERGQAQGLLPASSPIWNLCILLCTHPLFSLSSSVIAVFLGARPRVDVQLSLEEPQLRRPGSLMRK